MKKLMDETSFVEEDGHLIVFDGDYINACSLTTARCYCIAASHGISCICHLLVVEAGYKQEDSDEDTVDISVDDNSVDQTLQPTAISTPTDPYGGFILVPWPHPP